jgi:hypothetical protein
MIRVDLEKRSQGGVNVVRLTLDRVIDCHWMLATFYVDNLRTKAISDR